MILTPNCQLLLDFQNNIVDKGHGGLSWTAQGDGVDYEDGLFGKTYKFNSPSNWLSAGNQLNPFNYSDSFTHIAIFKTGVNEEMHVGDLGLRANSTPTDNIGLDIMLVIGGNVFFRIDQYSTENYGAGFGRYRGSVNIPSQEWVFVACRRTNTRADAFYVFYESTTPTFISEGIDFTGGNLTRWESRAYRIGARGTDTADSISASNTDGVLNKIAVYNKALSESDIRRLVHLFHPLNG